MNSDFAISILSVLLSAIVGGIIAKMLRQPLMLGYIVAGIVVGSLLPALQTNTSFTAISDTGVVLLMFALGLEFSFHRLWKFGKRMIPLVMLQLISLFLLSLLLFIFHGDTIVASVVLALSTISSSTVIIIKYLSERGETETTHGQVLTVWSIIQDVTFVPLFFLLPVLSSLGTGEPMSLASIFMIIAKALVITGIILLLVFEGGRRGMPWILKHILFFKSRELFTIVVIGIIGIASVATQLLGLSPAIGAFLVGLVLSETAENHAIFAEIRPLRDVFAVIFFVTLGLSIPLGFIVTNILSLIVMIIILITVRSFIVGLLTRSLGHHPKTAFLTALGMIPMSEFGFILSRLGTQSGILTHQQYLFVSSLLILSIIISSPLLLHSLELYKYLSGIFPSLRLRPKEQERDSDHQQLTNHIVICGYGRVGRYIGRALAMHNIPHLVVDYNQATIKELTQHNASVLFGDPGDLEVLRHANIKEAKAVVIAIPDLHTQELIIGHVLTLNRNIHIMCRTHHEEDQKILKSLGVQTIIQPEFEAALSMISRLLPKEGIHDFEGTIQRLKIEHGMG
jgi:monovalent cation:H+ antiporter-2, CPA2 family